MLHVIGVVIILMGLFGFIYLELKKIKKSKNQDSEVYQQVDILLSQRILQEKRKNIISSVHEFLQQSKFIKPLAQRGGEKIYQYVYSDGFLYEFKEILVGSNKKIGKNTEDLCFRELSYARVNDPQKFLENFVDLINTTPVGNPNVEDRGLGLTTKEMEEFKMDIPEVEKPLMNLTTG